jgi:hypothetical protein
MPVPSYFAKPQKPFVLREVTGGLSSQEIRRAIESGARFVSFPYTISALLFTTRRYSRVFFLKPGEGTTRKSLRYVALTLILGWWSLYGLFYTPLTLYKNMRGGLDLTERVLLSLPPATAPTNP